MSEFEKWFCDCIICCASEPGLADNYKWNIYDCAEWKEKFSAGLSPVEAVLSKFHPTH